MKTIATSVIVGLIVVTASLWMFQRRLMYFPAQHLGVVPTSVEEVTYTTDDGVRLSAWFLPADSQPIGTVIVFNGNAGNRADRFPVGESLRARGLSVLLVDYRGYGGNPGSPSQAGLEADARAALAYVRSRPDVDPDRVIYFGESLGSGVAVGLAVTDPPAALVLRSPFTSMADVAAVHYPVMGFLVRDRYPNLETIPQVDAPLMVVAGSADRIVPAEQSRKLFEAALRPVRYLEQEGADHNDWELASGDQMVNEVVRFLIDELAGRSQARETDERP
jgi:uncharacterized protein